MTRPGPDLARTVLAEVLAGLDVDVDEVAATVAALVRCVVTGGKLLVFGNGGSAACAQHLAAELVGRMARIRPALPAIALTTDASLLTAVANDFGFGQVFSRQVEALGRPGDVALGISTSGRSENVLAGLSEARVRGLTTVGLAGTGRSALHEIADITISAGGSDPQRVQELHLVVQHALCAALETALFDASPPPHGRRILEWPELVALRTAWHGQGRRLVWFAGRFATLDAERVRALSTSRGPGDVLVVGIEGDDGAAERAELVTALRAVDHAVLLDGRTPAQAVAMLGPDACCPETP